MTYSPQTLLDVRAYLLPITGLDPAGLGIQHYAPGGGGYHEGHDLLHAEGVAPEDPGSDYSYDDSPRDRAGLTDAASAIDIGDFAGTYNGQPVSLRAMTLWLLGQLRAGAPDTLDIREMIYTPDGQVVRRWDRTGKQPDTGDDTHLWHTHISFFRDSELRAKVPLFQRYFEGADMYEQYDRDRVNGAYNNSVAALNTLAVIAKKVDITPDELAQIQDAAKAGTAAALAAGADDFAAKVLAALPPATGGFTLTQVEAAVKEALRTGTGT